MGKIGVRIPKKKGNLSFEEDVDFAGQLIEALEESLPKLENSYNKKDSEDFDDIKIFMGQIQKEISETLK